MFTGIIEAKGTITAVTHHEDNTASITIQAPSSTLEGLSIGGSLAVSGVCLTAVNEIDTRHATAVFEAVAMGETLARSSLGTKAVGAHVNLERCTRAGDRLDGHIVQGHVDAQARVAAITDEGSWRRLRFTIEPSLAGHVAEKGAIAVDGVSLTITTVSAPTEHNAWFEVALIPETLNATTLGELTEGDLVNIETDVLAKYTARLLAVRDATHTP